MRRKILEYLEKEYAKMLVEVELFYMEGRYLYEQVQDEGLKELLEKTLKLRSKILEDLSEIRRRLWFMEIEEELEKVEKYVKVV